MRSKIPKGWKRIQLGEVVRSVSERPSKDLEKVVTINTSDVLNGEVLNHVPIENKKLPGQFIKAFNKGDILFSEIRPINKRSAYIDFNSDSYVASSKLMVLRTDSKYLDPRFFYYYITSKSTLEYLQLLAETRSGTFPQIRYTEVKTLDFNLPPIREQNFITENIDMIDNKIELNNKINKNLEAQAQVIFKHWFIDFEFPDENGNPYKSSGGEMIESELGIIPKGWEVKKIKDISKDIVLGKTPSTVDKANFGGDIPFLTIPDMHNKLYVDKTERTLSKKGENTQFNKTVPKNSICVSCIATPGLVSITKEPTQTNQQISTIIPSIEYTYVYSQMKAISNKIISLGSGGTATKNLNKTQFSNIQIVVPSELSRKRYHDFTKVIFKAIKMNQKQNQKLSQLRDTLLPKLMSGEVRIPLD